jgi:hypothetical protein
MLMLTAIASFPCPIHSRIEFFTGGLLATAILDFELIPLLLQVVGDILQARNTAKPENESQNTKRTTQ